jgi:catechol 2,3-dioxygenase-like lactoylglutathione lyase family enzyme
MRDFSILDASGNRLDFGEPIREEQPAAGLAPAATALKVFVPAKDFALSKRFYHALGFAQNWEDEGLAELELAGCRLLLQDFYVPEWAGNFMIHIEVPDADAWAHHARAVIDAEPFAGARVDGPRTESWGYRVTYVHDPSGVLLRFSQRLARP